ncbi:MAG: hypothetical protein ACXAC7_14160 [Candidatus Hodarchaeales archaeon]|jgi:hypothetical protein
MEESKYLDDNPAEKSIIVFPKQLTNVTPSHPAWSKRVSLEIRNLMQFIDFLKKKPNSLWFFLKPCDDRRFNFQRWDGSLKIPSRPDIAFNLRIVLTSEYPKVFPRAFAEESIKDYCAGNIYPKNIWQDNSKDPNSSKFIMICHDHMKDTKAWQPELSIAHFFIREVWFWWTSKINRVIIEWDKKKMGGSLSH